MMWTSTRFQVIPRPPPETKVALLEAAAFTEPDDGINTARKLVDWAAGLFEENNLYYGHGTDNARDEAAYLVLRSLDYSLEPTDEVLDRALDTSHREKVIARVRERISTRKPAAYILNEAWFAGLPFYVDESVLVPRSPLAELILDGFAPWCNPEKVRSILDIGTGSGCIAIACAGAFPQACIDATDISAPALAVAEKNIRRHDLGDRIRLIQYDLFPDLGTTYDLIISNPPYVDNVDMAELPAEYRHEPKRGLSGGDDGLDFVIRILENAANYLDENGVLVVEVGNGQEKLQQLYPAVPFLWMEFEHGGDGVFLLTRDELVNYFPVS